jgi:hypothetical protein
MLPKGLGEMTKVYVIVEHMDKEPPSNGVVSHSWDCWSFDSYQDALKWLSDYPKDNYIWMMTNDPAQFDMAEAEFTPWKD